MWYMKEGQRYTERKNNRKKRVNWTSVFAALWFWLCSNRASGPSVAVLMKRALQPHSSLTVSSNHFSSPHSPPSPHHSPVLVSFPHTSCSLPACTLPLWSMCCAPAETCWGSRKREYLQISQMGLSSAPILHTHSSSSITATTATHSQGHCYTNTGILATLNLSTQTFSLTSLSIHIFKPFQAS